MSRGGRRSPPPDSNLVPTVTVSTPGKLILMGEHAVVYGRPALVAAVDLRLSATLSSPPPGPGAGGVRLDLPGLSHSEDLSWSEVLDYARAARGRWQHYSRQPGPESFRELRGEDPAHVVKIALGEAAASLETSADTPPAPLHLRIDSEIPIGSGFGSSAATATAVIAGYLALASVPDLARIERLALEVERRQHGMPSGVDGATVLHGGILSARKLPSGELETERIAGRSPLLSRLRVYDTGMPPEPTGAVVAAVRGLRDRDPAGHERLLDRISAATEGLREELAREEEDPERTVHLLREHQACLEALGVVPGAVRAAVREIEAAGGAAKISGAGSLAGPGAGSLLVYDPFFGRLSDHAALQSFRFYPVHLGAPGFRQEEGVG